MTVTFLLACAVNTEPPSLEDECLDDYVADACFLSAVDGHTKEDSEVLFGMGAKFGNVASSYPVRYKWPAKRWGAMFEAKDLPAIYHGYSAACGHDLADGCYELGNFLSTEGKHPAAARGPYRRACELGQEQGCLAVASYAPPADATP